METESKNNLVFLFVFEVECIRLDQLDVDAEENRKI